MFSIIENKVQQDDTWDCHIVKSKSTSTEHWDSLSK